MMTRMERRPVWAAGLVLSVCAPAMAQCGLSWLEGPTSPGPNRAVYSMARTPNGDWLVGGDFTIVDDTFADRVARWDGSQWARVGEGVDGRVHAILPLQNGGIAIGGTFLNAGTSPFAIGQVGGVAVWNGFVWQSLSGGTNGNVFAMVQDASGDLIVAGQFTAAGGWPARRIARWDGFSWSQVGSGLITGNVYDLLDLGNGELLAGGDFLAIGAQPGGVAHFDGSNWTSLPGLPLDNHHVRAFAQLPNGDVAIGGYDIEIQGVSETLVIWNGTSVVANSPPLDSVLSLTVDASGDLVAAGGGASGSIARFDGSTWTLLGGDAPEFTWALMPDGADLVAGGQTTGVGPRGQLASFDGQAWLSFDGAAPPDVRTLQRFGDGDMIVGGAFAELDGTAVDNLARWDGLQWHALGLGVDATVTASALLPDGSLLVGGEFLNAGGSPATRVARWNGSSWSTMGNGLPSAPTSLAVSDDGDVFAFVEELLGVDRLYRFDGANWNEFANGPTGLVRGLVTLSNGEVAIYGGLSLAGQFCSVAAFDGAAFVPVDPGTATTAAALAVGPDGELVRSVWASSVSSIEQWDGSVWQPVGSASGVGGVLTFSADGQLFALAGDRMLRWTGQSWQQLADDIIVNGNAAIAFSGRNELFVGGIANGVGGLVSIGLARAEPTCPADAVTFGAGCSGGGGVMALTANGMPFLGATLSTTADGFSSTSLGVHVAGVQQIAQALPLGAAGCYLLVDPIVSAVLVPVGGTADAPLPIPDDSSLIGQQLYTQVIGVEFGAGLSLQQLASTNALQLTIGAL